MSIQARECLVDMLLLDGNIKEAEQQVESIPKLQFESKEACFLNAYILLHKVLQAILSS